MTYPLAFVAIGDTTVDEFIRLKDAHVNCDINHQSCTISMKWGDKIPYDFSVLVAGVGNAANAAVAAARLGLTSGFISNVGKDRYGEDILASFVHEGVDTKYVSINEGIPTNHHYVLWYETDRTILIRHEAYPYVLPEDFKPPKWLYLSSIGEHSESFHNALAKWIAAHPETKLAFQPGTFQMEMGKKKLSSLYACTELVACNKEEAERILEIGLPAGKAGETDMRELLKEMHKLGPKIVLITDGVNGAYASSSEEIYKVPMYPDPKPPLDRTGAGDASTSSIVAALALGKPLQEALLWGPVNAMSVVQEIGAQKGLLTRTALEKFLTEAPAEYRVELLS
jgi:sugar/nucleoside kinase (ribokinase family)